MIFRKRKLSKSKRLLIILLLLSIIFAVSVSFFSVSEHKHGPIFIITAFFMVVISFFLGMIISNEGLINTTFFWPDLKSYEEIRHESDLRFRKIFEESPFPMALTDTGFKIVKANISFCKMIGYSESELLSMTFRNFTHPDFIKRNEEALFKMISGELSIYKTEKLYVRKDGSVIWGSTTIDVIRNSKNQIQYLLAMVEDISDKKISNAELEKSCSILKATLESTADGLLVVDLSGKIVQYNQRFAEMWRIPVDLLETGDEKNALSFVKEQVADPEKFFEKVISIYSEPEMVISDIVEFSDGRFFERYSQPQLINGISVGRVWSFRDITERKKAEAEYITAKIKAEESDRLKTAFLHNVSHEIRTPMNAIIGFSTLLNDPALTFQERTQYTRIILQSGTQLLSIINDIVDIANIEAGQTKLKINEVNINTVLLEIEDQYKIKERSPGVSLNLKLPENGGRTIVTDSTKLIQIITNLLNNAIKFTSDGSIDFGYEQKEDSVEFFVTDTGIGIPEEHQEKIFNRFYQVNGATSRQYGGTGLGLSICKANVELLGGEIMLSSTKGKGSSFRFTVPFSLC